MHNVQLASPMNHYTKEIARLNKAKPSAKRTDDDRFEMARVEFEGGLYFDEGVGPYIPASWIFKSLLEGARLGARGRGQKIEGGVIVIEMVNPLIYKGPRDMAGLWGKNGDSGFVDFRSVRIGQAKVYRCRPIFREWRFEAELLLDPSVIDVDELADIAGIAGKLKGMGDFRQQYGRFDAAVERL